MTFSIGRILGGLALIVFVAAVAVSATGAFFSDTETSTGNTFTAGDIDLQIDNTSYVTNNEGELVASPNNTWTLSNLTNQLFFSFSDVKPGDIGEDTISVHAGSNNAWACMAADITATPENTLVDPETDAGDVGPANGDNGELQNFLNFTFWNDDGDNVYEVGETQITQLTGLASSIFSGNWLPLADSQNGTAIPGGSTRYIGKAWCFGTLTPNGTTQDGTGSSTPLTRETTGFTCDGSGNNNVAQTDGITVDVSFQAVQSRNNAGFLCSSLPPFVGTGGNQTLVGSNFSLYDNPNSCNVTVDDTGPAELDTIAEGLAAATAGQTVCVAPGTYNENVVISEGTILGATGAVGSAIINGGVEINADNVTVKGFKVNGGSIGVGPTVSGFFLMNGSDNVNITDNEIDGTGEAAGSRGIINAEGGTFASVLIENNFIHDWTSNIYMSTINDPADGTFSFTIRYNDLDDALASVGQLNEALVTLNEFSDGVVGAEAIGAGTDYDESVISFNNFLAGTMINNYAAPSDIEAPNNFFNVSAAVQAPVNVDTVPVAGAIYGHR